MRVILVLLLLVSSSVLKAQAVFPSTYTGYRQQQVLNGGQRISDSNASKKWSLSKYGGISTSFSFYRGGHASVVSVPVGLQLNRKLNNNLYAFAGIYVAPAYVNFTGNTLLAQPGKGFSNTTFLQRRFDVFTRADIGLMYVNDSKTFSISGSIGIERSSYPAFQYNQFNAGTPILPYQPVGQR